MSDQKIKCARCGEERESKDIQMGKIIYQGFSQGKKRVLQKTQPYCTDKPCHSHDQMAHEG